jgi:hypothetical protein
MLTKEQLEAFEVQARATMGMSEYMALVLQAEIVLALRDIVDQLRALTGVTSGVGSGPIHSEWQK